MEFESITEMVDQISLIKRAILVSDVEDSLPPISTSEYLTGLALLNQAQEAFTRAELWRVHAASIKGQNWSS